MSLEKTLTKCFVEINDNSLVFASGESVAHSGGMFSYPNTHISYITCMQFYSHYGMPLHYNGTDKFNCY